MKVTWSKSSPQVKEGKVTGTAKRSMICDVTGWPALPSKQNTSSAHVPERRQQWTTVKKWTINKHDKQTTARQEKSFAPLTQEPELLSDDLDNHSSSHSRVKCERKSDRKRLQTGPQTLIAQKWSAFWRTKSQIITQNYGYCSCISISKM